MPEAVAETVPGKNVPDRATNRDRKPCPKTVPETVPEKNVGLPEAVPEKNVGVPETVPQTVAHAVPQICARNRARKKSGSARNRARKKRGCARNRFSMAEPSFQLRVCISGERTFFSGKRSFFFGRGFGHGFGRRKLRAQNPAPA